VRDGHSSQRTLYLCLVKSCMMIRKQLIYVALVAWLLSLSARAACINPVMGINLAGAEFAPSVLPGVEGIEYKFPTSIQIEKYMRTGFGAIRLPILWERIQPELYGDLHEQYVRSIERVARDAERVGVKVVIDLHNYGRYRGKIVGVDIDGAAFRDVWKRIAMRLREHGSIAAYGLMNEPNDARRVWHRMAQFGVDGIRDSDRRKDIYIGGDGWSNAVQWVQANPRPFVIDPEGRERYEVHLYLDDDASGRYLEGHPKSDPESRVRDRLAPYFAWLKKYGKVGVIGEFGVPSDDDKWFSGVQEFYAITKNACIDSYYWAGGAFSPKNILSLEPRNGEERLLMKKIKSYITTSK